MRNHDMTRRQRGRHLPNDVEQRVVVRDKNLDVVAHLGELGGSTDEVRHRTRISVPYENVKSLLAEVIRDAASNDSEADYAHIFSSSSRHLLSGALAAAQPAAKRPLMQCRS